MSPADTTTAMPLWVPSAERAQSSAMWRFAEHVGLGLDRHGYGELHRWSVAEPDAFWRAVWSFCGGVRTLGDEPFCNGSTGRQPPGTGMRFFPGAQLNLAANYLAERPGVAADSDALVFVGEDGSRRTLSWAELRQQVARCRTALAADGVGVGDRVATMLPNGPEAIIVLLAAASLGATYSSVSPDFGAAGVLDRFGQIDPKVLVSCDGYHYGGSWHDVSAKAAQVAAQLNLGRWVVAPYEPGKALASTAGELPDDLVPVSWDEWLKAADGPRSGAAVADAAGSTPADIAAYEAVGFDHPAYVLYSSGTTGAPKCIVHRTGGVLAKHYSELVLHCDVGAGDRVFFFTTTGWMMWNWLVAALSVGATVVLYDGSPFHPDLLRLFQLADDESITFFGVGAKFVESSVKAGVRPAETCSLSTVRTIASTGSPLSPEGFTFLHRHVSPSAHLVSFSGGTDICGCFVTGNPTAPVHAGEIQVPALGVDAAVFDEGGRQLGTPGLGGAQGEGGLGELVCTNAFVSMPLEFYNDPDGERMSAAYFDRFDGVWHHGDFARWTSNGGMVIEGRSDAVLNPGGVRIGTAEIYRQLEQMPEVADCVVIGQEVGADGEPVGDTAGVDVRVVLFVCLADGLVLDEQLTGRIRSAIRAGASPRHVPAVIAQVPAIPRTRSGKLVELAVRDVVHGRTPSNANAIDNPAALEHFADHPALRRSRPPSQQTPPTSQDN